MVLMYLDVPPEITTPDPPPIPDPNNPQPPNPPDPQVTPEDLAALETVWRLVVGYDQNTNQLILHDPAPEGMGFKGGKEVRFGRSDFDKMWNVYQLEDGTISTHRYGVSAAPWSIGDMDYPDEVEAGTTFEITANISYTTPVGMEGGAVEDPIAFLDIPADFSMDGGSPSKTISVSGPRTFSIVTWSVKAPDTTYSGQDQRFWINTSGMITESEPAHRDNIGGSLKFDIEAYGFLNHPPTITTAMIDPPYIPDDGSVQPLVTCMPFDEDGNIIQVSVDLSSVDGSPVQRMYDSGRNGDEIGDDGTYSYMINRELPVGDWTFMITVKDSKAGYAYANVSLRVDPISEFTEAPDIQETGMTPKGVPNDGITTGTVWAIIVDEENDIDRVVVDLEPIGGDDKQRLYDDGTNGDLFSNDDNYSFTLTVNPLTELGSYQLEITASDTTGHESIDRVWIDVVLPPVAPIITAVSPEPEEIYNDGESLVTLTAIVEDGNDDVVEVWVNLAPLKGPSTSMMRDDGVSPDTREGDGMWTIQFSIPESVSSGSKPKIDVTAKDSTNLETTESFSLKVLQTNADPVLFDFNVDPDGVVAPGTQITVKANVSDSDLDLLQVELILSELNIENVILMDDGEGADESAGDLQFSGTFMVPESSPTRSYNVTIRVTDPNGGEATGVFLLSVSTGEKEEEASETLGIPIYLYIGLPAVLGLVLLLLIVANAVRSKGPDRQTPPGRPGAVPPQMQRAPPMMSPMR